MELLVNLDHGSISELVGDGRLIELLSRISSSTKGEVKKAEIVLNVIGGEEKLLFDKNLRSILLRTLPNLDRIKLLERLGIRNFEDIILNEKTKQKLTTFFGVDYHTEVNEEKVDFKIDVVSVAYPLFEHQSRALESCEKILQSSSPHVMLHMPTGSGKTRSAMHLVSRKLNKLKSVVIWIVSGKELCQQAADEFETAWKALGNRPMTVVKLWNETRGVNPSVTDSLVGSELTDTNPWPRELEDAFIIASIESLRNLANSWEPGDRVLRRRKISLIVFDEAHRSVAKTYLETINLLREPKTCLLGLSATPGRTHYGDEGSQNNELIQLFSDNKVTLEIPGYDSPVDALVAQGYLASLHKEKLEIASPRLSPSELEIINRSLEKTFELPSDYLKTVGYDSTRNLMIVDRIEKLVKDEGHRRIIVFAPSVESSELISNILSIREIISKSITANTNSKHRNETIELFKSTDPKSIVLCNFGVLTTGFDAPKTSAVVIARPTNSIVLLNQMAGRAIRGPKVNGNKIAKLITVVDTNIPQLVNTIDQFHAFDNYWNNKDIK